MTENSSNSKELKNLGTEDVQHQSDASKAQGTRKRAGGTKLKLVNLNKITKSNASSNGSSSNGASSGAIPKKSKLATANSVEHYRRPRAKSNGESVKPLSTASNRRTVSMTETSAIDAKETESVASSMSRRRRRGGRGKKKSKKEENNEEQECGNDEDEQSRTPPLIVTTVTPTLQLNLETFLILDLLCLEPVDREQFLLQLAFDRKLILQNNLTRCYEMNPRIAALSKHVLVTGTQIHNFNAKDWERLKNIPVNKNRLRLNSERPSDQKSPNTKKKPYKVFEELVNEVVLDDIPKEKTADFTLPTVQQENRNPNYFNEDEFNQNLEAYAHKLVEAKLGEIFEGEIRINAKNNSQAFVRCPDQENDIFIPSRILRKNALHGDIVRVFMRTHPEAPNLNISSSAFEAVAEDNADSTEIDPDLEAEITPELISTVKSRVGFVLRILKEVHNRRCVGTISPVRKVDDYVIFVPRDLKLPHMRIDVPKMPEELRSGKTEGIGDVLYVAEITGFHYDQCDGKLICPVGKCGELESENKAILLQNNLSMEPYEEKFNEMYREPLSITEEDLKQRDDLRKECIFTIDPLTARDLDDAMSVKELPDGNFEIGVHISDVTHFLEEDSELDNIVKTRTTSVYMVNEVFHMLPKPLCFKCSLLPGEDKFAFSVFWSMTGEGEVLTTRFTRSVVNSCTQLAYEHAQKIIDNPNEKFTQIDFPQIHNGYTVDDIVSRVKTLHSIAEKLRLKRFENGALRINRPKLYFDLHPETGEPTDFALQTLNTANFLIEEFMLLANQSVADFIHKKFPKIAILRNHPPPTGRVIKLVQEKLSKLGLNLDISSSKKIFDSMQRILNEASNPEILESCLTHLVSKSMKRAIYYCSEKATDKEHFAHYALSIPIYTHFTSPIRRYPDVLVHRLLSAALGYSEPPKRSTDEFHRIASVCNEMKFNAKNAGDDSSNLYFLHYIKSKKSMVFRAAILDILTQSIEVVLIKTGHVLHIRYSQCKGTFAVDVSKNPKTAVLKIKGRDRMDLKLFDEIDVTVSAENNKLTASFKHLEDQTTNEKGTKTKKKRDSLKRQKRSELRAIKFYGQKNQLDSKNPNTSQTEVEQDLLKNRNVRLDSEGIDEVDTNSEAEEEYDEIKNETLTVQVDDGTVEPELSTSVSPIVNRDVEEIDQSNVNVECSLDSLKQTKKEEETKTLGRETLTLKVDKNEPLPVKGSPEVTVEPELPNPVSPIVVQGVEEIDQSNVNVEILSDSLKHTHLN